jgi:hypothetical protein
MFEITAEDIACLGDEALRALIGRLCETELRKRGFSPAFATWGGNQNAPDGGIDVRVALPAGSAIDGFVPRATTGFQVKAQDMARAEILNEMRPKGVLRPSIQSLADQSGAYVIVSSQGSTSDTALTDRRVAMRDAVKDAPDEDRLALEFYDRNRVATWVRSNEFLIPWVRMLVRMPIPGWQSYGPWASPVDEEYLLDEKLRVYSSEFGTPSGLSAFDGIRRVRQHLKESDSRVSGKRASSRHCSMKELVRTASIRHS